MQTEKINAVLKALQKDRMDTLTRQSLVNAFKDDGIFDLETVAEHMMKRIKKDAEVQRTILRAVDFSLLGQITSKDIAKNIAHKVPEIPFLLNAVEYDPKDIIRFNSNALLFIPIKRRDGSEWLQVFHEDIKPSLASYLQLRYIDSLINQLDFPGFPPQTPPGTPPGTSTPGIPTIVGCGGTTGVACGAPPAQPPKNTPPPTHVEPQPPITYSQVQMFEDADYSGDWFWLDAHYMWTDLTEVSRGGWFGGDWNDEISSLSSTYATCVYCEHTNLQGSTLFLGPNSPTPHLSKFGWNDRISSVVNYG
ncbi:MAG: hypothetical protein IT249_08635 [Chitinophagaceae bacterium]|nr:hypothetical protein [Chitinophagaceae bacterium]